MFFAKPNQTGKFHIFTEKDKKSLCGRWAMPFFKIEEDDKIVGDELYNNMNDCKTCFDKLAKTQTTDSNES